MVYYTLLSGLIYSLIEIEIEGPNGWCEKLPTCNFVKLGSKNMILYHIYMLIYLTITYISMYTFTYNSISIENVCNVVSNISLFLMVEDVLWFSLNPYYTIGKYTKEDITWHSNQPWIFSVPLDNYIILTLHILLSLYDIIHLYNFVYSTLFIKFINYFVSGAYHDFYLRVH